MQEQDIRPKALFDDFLTATEEDAQQLCARAGEWQEVACPACDTRAVASRFTAGASAGMTISASMPIRRAAIATPCA